MDTSVELRKFNETYFKKTETTIRELFELAKNKNELHFALSLNSEFRGEQDPGWSTADEMITTFSEYVEYLNNMQNNRMKIRIALAFYCHLSEASGFYEIPKNMLRVYDGEKYNMLPFRCIVKSQIDTGKIIVPNSNAIMRNLIGHAKKSGLNQLAEVLRDAFDYDIRNCYAHADYIVWDDGLWLRFRNGGNPRKFDWSTFSAIYDRGINFFNILQIVIKEYIHSYSGGKIIEGQLDNEPKGKWNIKYDQGIGSFSVSS